MRRMRLAGHGTHGASCYSCGSRWTVQCSLWRVFRHLDRPANDCMLLPLKRLQVHVWDADDVADSFTPIYAPASNHVHFYPEQLILGCNICIKIIKDIYSITGYLHWLIMCCRHLQFHWRGLCRPPARRVPLRYTTGRDLKPSPSLWQRGLRFMTSGGNGLFVF